MRQVVRPYPDQELHVILDNSSTHGTPAIRDWLTAHPRVHFHYTPTSASWLNQVEGFFGIFGKQSLSVTDFPSKKALREHIAAYMRAWRKHPAPFAWTKPAQAIIRSHRRMLKRISTAVLVAGGTLLIAIAALRLCWRGARPSRSPPRLSPAALCEGRPGMAPARHRGQWRGSPERGYMIGPGPLRPLLAEMKPVLAVDHGPRKASQLASGRERSPCRPFRCRGRRTPSSSRRNRGRWAGGSDHRLLLEDHHAAHPHLAAVADVDLHRVAAAIIDAPGQVGDVHADVLLSRPDLSGR